MTNKSKSYLNIALVILTGIVVFSFWRINDMRKVKNENVALRENISNLMSYFWERDFIVKKEITFEFENDSLFQYVTGVNQLGLWISDKQCNECVDYALKRINELPDSILDKTIVFMDYTNPRLQKIIIEQIPAEIPVVKYSFGELDAPYNSTFFAFISSYGEVKMIFYPSKEIPMLTSFYFSKIFPLLVKKV